MKENSSSFKRNDFLNRHLGILVLIFLHLIIVLPLAYVLNIWADEASTLYTTENGFLQTFQNALADEKQAPLYFWLLSLWRGINHSIFFARLFSIVCSLLAIKFFHDLTRKLFDEKAAAFITAFFALHPFLIWASLEIRVYSLVVLLSVLLLKFFSEGFLTEKNISREDAKTPEKPRIFFVLTAIVALYANYYLGFLLVGFFAALLVLRKFDKARQFFLQMLLVGLVFAPLIWAIKEQFAVNTGGFQPSKSVVEGLQILWNHFLTFVFPTEIFTPDEQTRISFLRVWLARAAILAVAILLFRPFYKIWKNARANRQNDGAVRFLVVDFDEKLLTFGAIFGTVSLFLLVAYFLLGAIYVEIRHAAVLFAPSILFVFAGLINLLPRRVWLAFALAFTVLFSYSVYTLYPDFTKRGDWARIAAFLEQNEKTNQPIVVFRAFEALALPYHYKGKNKILPDEKFFAFAESEGEPGSADAFRKQLEFIISEIPPDAPEIWLVTNDNCAVKDTCAPLENFVAANYTITEEKDFYKEKVRLLRKKQK